MRPVKALAITFATKKKHNVAEVTMSKTHHNRHLDLDPHVHAV